MIIIKHRVNTLKELSVTDKKFGVEIDIRSNGNDLILQHDPFVQGEKLIDWLQAYDHAFLILNVKEEGLETEILTMMKKFSIKSFFFLDQSFPFLIKYAEQSEGKSAVRLSEFETIDTVKTLMGLVNWIWVDCFTGEFPNIKTLKRANKLGFKICLVSPELQNYYDDRHLIFIDKAQELKIISAVCTKFPDDWLNTHSPKNV